jgi:hypothetical protein
METNTLFELKGKVYKAMDASDSCTGCAGFENQYLCRKLPFCGLAGSRVRFRKLNAREIRKAKKSNTEIVKL